MSSRIFFRALKFKYILISTLVLFLYGQTYFLGKNDWISLIFIIISSSIIFQVMYQIQISNRRTLRVHAKKGSFLYNFLSSDISVLSIAVAFIASFLLSIGMTVMLKGIVRQHGEVWTFLGLIVISFIIFSLINKNHTKVKTIEENLHEDISTHIHSLAYLFSVSMVLNIVLSLMLSYGDTKKFLSNEININNFDNISIEESVIKQPHNDTSRLLLNVYVLTDNFKHALADLILTHYIESERKDDYFLPLFIIVAIFNFMKLFPFSFSFVLLQKGLENFIKKIFSVYKREKNRS